MGTGRGDTCEDFRLGFYEKYARHIKMCGRVDVGGARRGGGMLLEVGLGEGVQVRMVTCGRDMRVVNLARHQSGACRVWDPAG